jgi:hypothetical protein
MQFAHAPLCPPTELSNISSVYGVPRRRTGACLLFLRLSAATLPCGSLGVVWFCTLGASGKPKDVVMHFILTTVLEQERLLIINYQSVSSDSVPFSAAT